MPTAPLVFTTDFGLSDPYAGVMKGVALTINPNARLIDLTHQISPQNVVQGSFLLGLNHSYFPKNAIHVAVVDPFVGTDRRPVLVDTPWGRFVAPDNGLLSGVLDSYIDNRPSDAAVIKIPLGIKAVHISNPQYWNHPVSQTFHGRDIFTPVAAHLSLGVEPKDIGETIDDLFYLPMTQPNLNDKMITGQIIYQDVYGNLVSNISAGHLPDGTQIEIEIEGRRILGLSETFNDPKHGNNAKLVALIGSHGYLEIAVPNGHAGALLRIRHPEGVPVIVVSG